MFNNSTWDAVERGFSYLERIFAMFVKILETLFGGGNAGGGEAETTTEVVAP